VLWHILCRAMAHFVPCYGTFCAVLWHILCRAMTHFVPSRAMAHKSFCSVLWHILCLPVAHKPKSLFVPCYGTFCAFPWQVKNCKSRIASQELQVKNCKSRIASQELQVKNCKSRIASQELQKTRLKILPVLTREHYTSLLHWV
jgi:hypothetical protein